MSCGVAAVCVGVCVWVCVVACVCAVCVGVADLQSDGAGHTPYVRETMFPVVPATIRQVDPTHERH